MKALFLIGIGFGFGIYFSDYRVVRTTKKEVGAFIAMVDGKIK